MRLDNCYQVAQYITMKTIYISLLSDGENFSTNPATTFQRTGMKTTFLLILPLVR